MKKRDWPANVVLLGYFGRGNIGDDAMLEGLAAYLRESWPAAVFQHVPLPAFSVGSRREISNLYRALRWADLVVLNGGTYFHDGLGGRSLRILTTFLGVFLTARILGARIACAGIGVGPLRHWWSKLLTRAIVSLSDVTLVRDRASTETALALRTRTRVLQGFDTAALLPLPTASGPRDTDALGISLVPYFTNYERRPEADARAVEHLRHAFAGLREAHPTLGARVFVFHRGRGESDSGLAEQLVTQLGRELPTELVWCESPTQVLAELASLRGFIATRYHALMLGYLVETPLLAVQYDQKCQSLAEQIHLPAQARLVPSDLLDRERVVTTVRDLVEQPGLFRSPVPVNALRGEALAGLAEFTRVLQALRRPPGV